MARLIRVDGVVHTFPDDASDDEISAALSPPTPEVAGPQSPSINSLGPEGYSGPSYGPNNPTPSMSHLGGERSLRLAGENLGYTAGTLAGMPVDLATTVVNAPGHLGRLAYRLLSGQEPPDRFNLPVVGEVQYPIQRPVGGSASIRDAATEAAQAVAPGYAPVAESDKTMTEKAIRNVIDFGAQGAASGAGLARVAAQRGVDMAPRIGDRLLQNYLERPGAAMVADTAAGAGSGVGATIARELAPGNPLAEFGAAVLGGGVGASTLSGPAAVKGIGQRIVNKVTGNGVPYDPQAPLMPVPDRSVYDAATYLQNRVKNAPAAQRAISENAVDFANADLPQPSVGLMSQDPGLVGVEQSLRRTVPGTSFVEKDNALRAAAAEKAGSVRPDVALEDMRAPQEYAKQEAGKQVAAAEGQVRSAEGAVAANTAARKTLDQSAEAMAAPVVAQRGDSAAATASRQLDEQVTGALSARTAEKNARFDALPDTPVDAGPIRERAARIRASTNALRPDEQLPTEFLNRLDTLDSPEVPLNQLADARKYLNTAGDRAQKSGNHELARNIRDLKSEINVAIEKHPDAEGANAFYRDQYADYFATGKGRDMRDKVQRDPNGRQTLPPERMAEFWLNDTEDSAAHLARIMRIAPNPQAAQQAARNFLIGDLARKTVPDKRINPVALNKWLEDNRGKLREPEYAPLYNEVVQLQRNVLNNQGAMSALERDVVGLNQQVRNATANKQAVQNAINESMLGVFIKSSPQKAAASMFASSDPLASAQQVNKTIAGAPPVMQAKLRDAWQASVADTLVERITNSTNLPGTEMGSVNLAKLTRQMKQNDEVLTEVFRGQPEKLQQLKIAQKALEPLVQLNQQASRGSVTIEASEQAKQLKLALEAGLKLKYGVLAGGGYTRGLKIAAASILGDTTPQTIRLLERAFTTEPQLMKQLLEMKLKTPRPGYNQRVNRGIAAQEASQGDDERKPNELRITIQPDDKTGGGNSDVTTEGGGGSDDPLDRHLRDQISIIREHNALPEVAPYVEEAKALTRNLDQMYQAGDPEAVDLVKAFEKANDQTGSRASGKALSAFTSVEIFERLKDLAIGRDLESKDLSEPTRKLLNQGYRSDMGGRPELKLSPTLAKRLRASQ